MSPVVAAEPLRSGFDRLFDLVAFGISRRNTRPATSRAPWHPQSRTPLSCPLEKLPVAAQRLSSLCHDGAAKLSRETVSQFTISKAPADDVPIFLAPCQIAKMPDNSLRLIRADKSRPSGEWSDDDYDVFHGDRHIGRIFLHPQAPAGRPWFWSITAGEAKSSIFNKGYSASREQAMADFKAQWIKRRIGT